MWQIRVLTLLSLFLLSNSTANVWTCAPASSLEEAPATTKPPALEWPREKYQACRLARLEASVAYALRQESSLGEKLSRQIVTLTSRESQRYGLPPLLVLGMVLVESGGNPRALSSEGAQGLMQVLPSTGQFIAACLSEKWRGVGSLYEVETSIRYGTWYLHYLQEMFEGNPQAALAAYNWGPEEIQGRLEKGQRLPQVYPRKIREAKARIEERMYDYYQIYSRRSLCSPGNRAGPEESTR